MILSTAKISRIRSISVLMVIATLSACSTPQKMSDAQLQSRNIIVGADYWLATAKLSQDGYSCFVTGAKRERFYCTKSTGVFPTCLLRIEFTVNDENKIFEISVRDAACMGTP